MKYRLIERMRAIRADDRMIQAEGVESLNYFELREALAYRGMRSAGLSQPAYMEELKSWLDLHLNKNVPTTLLLMSRAFKITQKHASEEGAIKETLQAMSKEATNSAESNAVESDKVAAKLKKLDELQREQKLIEQERIERQEMLVADLHSSAGRFLDKNAANWLAQRIPVLTLRNPSPELAQDHGAAAAATGEEGKGVVETGLEEGKGGEASLLEQVRRRFEEEEDKLVAFVKESLQPRFSLVDLRAAQYGIIIQAELAARKERLIATLLEAPSSPEALQGAPSLAIQGASVAASTSAQARPAGQTDIIIEAADGAARGAGAVTMELQSSPPRASAAPDAPIVDAPRARVEEAMAEQVGSESGVESDGGVLGAQAAPKRQAPATKEAGSAHEELLDYRVLNEVAEMVTLMGSKNATEAEKEKLEEIKEVYEMTKADLDQVNEHNEVSRTARAVTGLRARVKNLVLRLDGDVQKAAEKIGNKFHQLDADGDGIITEDEIRMAIETRLTRKLEAGELAAVIKTFDVTKDGKIDLGDVHDIAHALSKARCLRATCPRPAPACWHRASSRPRPWPPSYTLDICARAHTHTHRHHIHTHIRSVGARGTGSVGDSVGEGARHGWCGTLTACLAPAGTRY